MSHAFGLAGVKGQEFAEVERNLTRGVQPRHQVCNGKADFHEHGKFVSRGLAAAGPNDFNPKVKATASGGMPWFFQDKVKKDPS